VDRSDVLKVLCSVISGVPPLVPKTLEVDDLGAASQSSIWTAFGLQTKGIYQHFQ
jgi:hypothetical protein